MHYRLILGAPYLGIDSFLSHFITVFASSFLQGIASTHSVSLSTITSRYWYPFVLCSHVSKISGNVLEWDIWDWKLSYGTSVSSCGHYRWHTQLSSYPQCAATTPPYFFELAFYWHALAWLKSDRVLLVPLFFHHDLHFFCLVSCFISFSHKCWVSFHCISWQPPSLEEGLLGSVLPVVPWQVASFCHVCLLCLQACCFKQNLTTYLSLSALDKQLDQLNMF